VALNRGGIEFDALLGVIKGFFMMPQFQPTGAPVAFFRKRAELKQEDKR